MSPAHGPLISHRYAQPEPGGQLPIPGNITTHVHLMSPAGHNKLNAWERAWLLAVNIWQVYLPFHLKVVSSSRNLTLFHDMRSREVYS